LLPFYPLQKCSSIYVARVTVAAAVSVLGDMGTVAKWFGQDMDSSGTETKSYPPKKKTPNKTKKTPQGWTQL